MSPTDRRFQLAVTAAVVAIFASLWLIAVVTTDHPRTAEEHLQFAVNWAVLAAPSVFAARLLWRAWWARSGASLSTMDGPARLVAAAAATLPDDRRERGVAMTAELTQIESRSSRWRFAAGCARAAMFPPLSSRVTVVVVGALASAAVVVAALAVGRVLPAMRVFAVAFSALVGAKATVGVARSRRVRRAAADPTIAAAVLIGVLTCLAVISYFLIKHSTAPEDLPPNVAVILAAVMASSLWLALSPPRWLSSSQLARRMAVAAALALGGGLVVASRFPGDRDNGVALYLIVATIVIFFVASAVTAAVDRSFLAGVQTAIWTAGLGMLLVLIAWLLEAMHWYQIDARLLLDGETGYSIGVNLGDAIVWTPVFLLVLGLPFGVIGGGGGSARWRRQQAREMSGLGPQQPEGHLPQLT